MPCTARRTATTAPSGRKPSWDVIDPCSAAVAKVPQAFQVVPENVAAARRKPVIVHDAVERSDHVVELLTIPAARSVIALQFIEFAIGAVEAVAIVAAKSVARGVIQVAADASEQLTLPFTAAVEFITLAIEAVVIPIVIAVIEATIGGRSGLKRWPPKTSYLPEDVERIAFRSALWIFDTDYGGSAAFGRANQSLSPAAIHAGKTEPRRV